VSHERMRGSHVPASVARRTLSTNAQPSSRTTTALPRSVSGSDAWSGNARCPFTRASGKAGRSAYAIIALVEVHLRNRPIDPGCGTRTGRRTYIPKEARWKGIAFGPQMISSFACSSCE
jgi:hypothetical protein